MTDRDIVDSITADYRKLLYEAHQYLQDLIPESHMEELRDGCEGCLINYADEWEWFKQIEAMAAEHGEEMSLVYRGQK